MAYVNNTNNKTNGQRINEMIRVREVRLIDDEGNQLGIVATQEALNMAKDRDLDLVEVSDRKSTRLNSSHLSTSRMPSSA